MKKNNQEIQLTSQLIAFNTSTASGQNKARRFLKKWCKENHLQITQPKETKALLIETQPAAKLHLSFVTHLDVVQADGWESAFRPEVRDGFLYGRGAVDDLGPLVICLQLLLLFKKDDRINISCLIVSDEETTNLEIQTILKSGLFTPDFGLVADGGTHLVMDIGQKGIIRLKLQLTTAGGHSAFEESEKSASIQLFNFMNELNAFGQKFEHHPRFAPAFINISSIKSESVPYGFPSQATASLEVQFPAPQKSGQWLNKIQELQKSHANCVIEVGWVSEPHILQEKKIWEILQNFPELKCITTGGNNLAKDLCLAGIPAVSHCPVEEYMGHCKDERIKVRDFAKGKKFYKNLIKHFIIKNGIKSEKRII